MRQHLPDRVLRRVLDAQRHGRGVGSVGLRDAAEQLGEDVRHGRIGAEEVGDDDLVVGADQVEQQRNRRAGAILSGGAVQQCRAAIGDRLDHLAEPYPGAIDDRQVEIGEDLVPLGDRAGPRSSAARWSSFVGRRQDLVGHRHPDDPHARALDRCPVGGNLLVRLPQVDDRGDSSVSDHGQVGLVQIERLSRTEQPTGPQRPVTRRGHVPKVQQRHDFSWTGCGSDLPGQ